MADGLHAARRWRRWPGRRRCPWPRCGRRRSRSPRRWRPAPRSSGTWCRGRRGRHRERNGPGCGYSGSPSQYLSTAMWASRDGAARHRGSVSLGSGAVTKVRGLGRRARDAILDPGDDQAAVTAALPGELVALLEADALGLARFATQRLPSAGRSARCAPWEATPHSDHGAPQACAAAAWGPGAGGIRGGRRRRLRHHLCPAAPPACQARRACPANSSSSCAVSTRSAVATNSRRLSNSSSMRSCS